VPLPYAGGSWVEWHRGGIDGDALELPLRPVAPATAAPLAPQALAGGRIAAGWWLLGSGRAMLALARQHALDRVQFGQPIASFQAVRHKLAETLVALDGAEAALRAAALDDAPGAPGFEALLAKALPAKALPAKALLAKAAAGQAGLLAARHCQQVLGGIGFTAEHALHHHVKRVLVLDGLLGSARELTSEAGRLVIADGAAPRLVDL
jgi:alkylation response protein AidB-like acyl-CoA dehydrogenase